MKNDFLNRIVLERDYKISLLHEKIETGNLEKDILFQSLNEIAILQYRFLGHSDIINLTAESTIEEKLKSAREGLLVLEKSISFVDGIVAALSSDSIHRHLLTPYYGRNNEFSVRDKIIVYGQNEILESRGFQPSD
jgi:hypothetical protein